MCWFLSYIRDPTWYMSRLYLKSQDKFNLTCCDQFLVKMVLFLQSQYKEYPVTAPLDKAWLETKLIANAFRVRLVNMGQGGKPLTTGMTGLTMVPYHLMGQILSHIVKFHVPISKSVNHGKQVVSVINYL